MHEAPQVYSYILSLLACAGNRTLLWWRVCLALPTAGDRSAGPPGEQQCALALPHLHALHSLLGLVAMAASCCVIKSCSLVAANAAARLLDFFLFVSVRSSAPKHQFPSQMDLSREGFYFQVLTSLLICCAFFFFLPRSPDDRLYPESHHRPWAQWDPRAVRPQQRQGQTRGERPQLLLDLRHRPQQLVGGRPKSEEVTHAHTLSVQQREVSVIATAAAKESAHTHAHTCRKYFHTHTSLTTTDSMKTTHVNTNLNTLQSSLSLSLSVSLCVHSLV